MVSYLLYFGIVISRCVWRGKHNGLNCPNLFYSWTGCCWTGGWLNDIFFACFCEWSWLFYCLKWVKVICLWIWGSFVIFLQERYYWLIKQIYFIVFEIWWFRRSSTTGDDPSTVSAVSTNSTTEAQLQEGQGPRGWFRRSWFRRSSTTHSTELVSTVFNQRVFLSKYMF